MRTVLRNTFFYSFSLFLLTQIMQGVRVSGDITSYILGGFLLFILFTILRPILNIISFPFNLITLGMFSFLINVIILYILTVFFSNISIASFLFKGLSFAGFTIPKVFINTFFAYVLASFFLSAIIGFLTWITKK